MMASRKKAEGEGIDFYLQGNDDRAVFLKQMKDKGLSVAKAEALAF